MKADDARKLYEESQQEPTSRDVIQGILNDIYKRVGKCSRKGKRTLGYHFGWIGWPFTKYFPSDREKESIIKTLQKDGYYVRNKITGFSEVNPNIITIEW